jgi:hypothetical protein
MDTIVEKYIQIQKGKYDSFIYYLYGIHYVIFK